MSDARLEANWRDLWMDNAGLLEPRQPTESAHVEYVRRMSAPFDATERRLIRAAFTPPGATK